MHKQSVRWESLKIWNTHIVAMNWVWRILTNFSSQTKIVSIPSIDSTSVYMWYQCDNIQYQEKKDLRIESMHTHTQARGYNTLSKIALYLDFFFTITHSVRITELCFSNFNLLENYTKSGPSSYQNFHNLMVLIHVDPLF